MYKALLSVLVGDAMLLSLILLEQYMHRRLRMPTYMSQTLSDQSSCACSNAKHCVSVMVKSSCDVFIYVKCFSTQKPAVMQPQSLSPEEVGVARNCAISQILGTDMKKHFDILSRFQVHAAYT